MGRRRDDDGKLTPKQAAAELGISRRQLDRLRKRGSIPFEDLNTGGTYVVARYDRRALTRAPRNFSRSPESLERH